MANPNKQFVSRELTGEVRSLCLKEIRKVLLGDDVDFKKQVILRLAGQILPRLNEHTGEDGDPINVKIINYDRDNLTIPLPAQNVSNTASPSATEGS